MLAHHRDWLRTLPILLVLVESMRGTPVERIPLNTRSHVTSISEELVVLLQRTYPEEVLMLSFHGSAPVETSFGEEQAITQQVMPLLLTLLTPWGKVR